MTLTRKQKLCTHKSPDGSQHYFEFSAGERNIWNPFEHQCTQCGVSVSEVVDALATQQGEMKALKQELLLSQVDCALWRKEAKQRATNVLNRKASP